MLMPGKSYSIANTNYRFGFNGKEKDDKDGIVQYDYGFRIYDPRLVRFKSVDPLFKGYPWNSPYSFAENEPISNIDLDGLEKYKVTIRTFLPYAYVWEPQAKDLIDKANTRWYPQYRNVEAHGGYKSQQEFNIDFYNGTTTYSTSVPITFSKDLTNKKVYAENNTSSRTEVLTKNFEDKANINTEFSTANPATPWYLPTPAIDYNFSISVQKDGLYTLKGKWDGFPAIEIFIENTETGQVDLIEFQKPSDAGKDLKNGNNPKQILNLFPILGDVKIDKIGQVGNSPQVDQNAPSPTVEENNKRFSEQDCKCDPKPRDYIGN